MLSVPDIHWMAGLLEGEASFIATGGVQPRISFASTDLDVVERVSKMWKSPSVRERHTNRLGKKTQWETTIYSSRAAGWMMTIYPLMGFRRRAQIRDILKAWKTVGGGTGRKGRG